LVLAVQPSHPAPDFVGEHVVHQQGNAVGQLVGDHVLEGEREETAGQFGNLGPPSPFLTR
jgi:hypothetical protein